MPQGYATRLPSSVRCTTVDVNPDVIAAAFHEYESGYLYDCQCVLWVSHGYLQTIEIHCVSLFPVKPDIACLHFAGPNTRICFLL